jgi:hypothetical protein
MRQRPRMMVTTGGFRIADARGAGSDDLVDRHASGIAAGADPDRASRVRVRLPAGCWGRSEDRMGVGVLLASDTARCEHGAVLAVDGGCIAR